MTSDQRELLRNRLLELMVVLRGPFGLPTRALFAQVRLEAWHGEDLATVSEELRYLEGKGLVEQVCKVISPENAAWRLTAEGRDYAAKAGME